ncbi:MAG: sulfatase-like hydrolase/transferase [Alphaproteobacteria bacterium]|nr:sulfatase-like hydrolase/transferase [Alphaproteobacteria bacterium]
MIPTARRAALLLGLLLPGCDLGGCGAEPVQPNLLVITLDTTRADMIGAYGNSAGATPTLDRLATEGVRFDRAYTVTPLTIPSHSSLFTGLYPPRHGVRDNGDFFLSDGAVTMAERLKGAGYATMASVGAEVTSHHWGFAQGFDTFYDDMGERDDANRWKVERRGDLVVNDALRWLEGHATTPEPWFAWVHLFDVHHPYEPPEPYATQFGQRRYLGELAWADAQVERLRAFLEQTDQLKDTWVFVMADHGEGLGSHGESLHGVLLYNATTHIPMIVRPPGGLPIARSYRFPVSLVDVLPTAMGALGLEVPQDVDGEDLSAFLAASSPEPPATRDVYVESLYAWHHYGWAPQKALVDTEHNLISSTTPELYAAGDAEQQDNLAPTHGADLQTIQGRLDALVAGLEPAGETADRAALSAERLAQLEALGYVTSVNDGAELPTEGLPDPVERLPVLREVEQVRKALQSNDFEAAVSAARAVIAQEPGLMEPRMMLASALARQGKVDEALAVVEEVLALRPNASQANAMLGTLRMQARDLPGAIDALAEAVAIDPYLPQAWLAYLNALFMAHDVVRLEAEVARARELLPEDVAIGGVEGLLLALKGQSLQARPLLVAAIAESPTQPFLQHGLGLALQAQGDVDGAESAFQEDIRLFPPAVPSRKALVTLYARQQRYEEQLAELEVVLQAEPGDVLNQHSQAQALFNLKRYEEAEQAVKRCRELAPEYPACAMLEANTLKKLGHEEAALVAYQRALELAKARGAQLNNDPSGQPAPPAEPPAEPGAPEAPAQPEPTWGP